MIYPKPKYVPQEKVETIIQKNPSVKKLIEDFEQSSTEDKLEPLIRKMKESGRNRQTLTQTPPFIMTKNNQAARPI